MGSPCCALMPAVHGSVPSPRPSPGRIGRVRGIVGRARHRGAAQALVDRFAPIMNEAQVRALQTDFVTVVGAVGEIDTGYPGIRVVAVGGRRTHWAQGRMAAGIAGSGRSRRTDQRQHRQLSGTESGWADSRRFRARRGGSCCPPCASGAGVAGAVLAAAGLRTNKGENS